MSVSIILPFKNAESWISETIQSILEQTYQNWEVIAINDFSNDNSASVIESFNDPRIKVVNNADQGIIPALQFGLTLAENEFITRMDADDIMPLNRLEIMTQAIQSNPKKSIITGKVKYISDQPISDGYNKYESWLNERVDLNDHYDHIYRECIIASPNWLARKEDLIEFGIFDLSYPEDYDMVFRWRQNDFKIVSLQEITLFWREHQERTSRNSSIYDQESFFNLKLDWFLQLNDVNEKSIAVFGAGKKGKLAVLHLQKEGIDVDWYDMNYQQYNSPVYQLEIKNPDNCHNNIALFAIYPDDNIALKEFINAKGFVIGKNAWFL